MNHFTHLSDLGVTGLQELLAVAAQWKATPPSPVFAGKLLGMLFFNPSLRTRVSFEAAMLRTGGHAVVLDVGGGTWQLEDRTGVVMDADRPEHIREAIPVLSRYVDALAVRTFGTASDAAADECDELLNSIRRYATVPVISMESAREHPCQGLADLLTMQEHLGGLRHQPITLSWAPHIKPLPWAVPHSFMLSAAAAGCDLTVAHPPGFELHPAVIDEAQAYAGQSGGTLSFTTDQQSACNSAAVVYAKSWAPSQPGLTPAAACELLRIYSGWQIRLGTLAAGETESLFMHCLPVRRNLVAADSVLDGPLSIVTDQAENRYHVQRAVLNQVFQGATA